VKAAAVVKAATVGCQNWEYSRAICSAQHPADQLPGAKHKSANFCKILAWTFQGQSRTRSGLMVQMDVQPIKMMDGVICLAGQTIMVKDLRNKLAVYAAAAG